MHIDDRTQPIAKASDQKQNIFLANIRQMNVQAFNNKGTDIVDKSWSHHNNHN